MTSGPRRWVAPALLLTLAGCGDEKAREAEAAARAAQAKAFGQKVAADILAEGEARLLAERTGDAASWAAAGLSWEHEGKSVRIAGASIGRPSHVAKIPIAKLEESPPVESSEPRLLVQVRFTYAEGGPPRLMNYWSGAGPASGENSSYLQDEHGSEVPFVAPTEGRVWAGRTNRWMIKGGESADDFLVFQLPTPQAKELRLFLPGRVVGSSKNIRLRFAVPASAANPPASP